MSDHPVMDWLWRRRWGRAWLNFLIRVYAPDVYRRNRLTKEDQWN